MPRSECVTHTNENDRPVTSLLGKKKPFPIGIWQVLARRRVFL